MRKQVLINVEATDIRVAVLEDGTLVELFVEDIHSKSKVGSIYKGRVEGIVPGLEAVFVNIGCEKNAFLHFSDVLPEYELPQRGRPERARRKSKPADQSPEDDDEAETFEDDEFVEPLEGDEDEEAGIKTAPRPPRRSRPLQVGDEILVQVTKDEISEKGARITSYISLPGRYLVMMPFSDQGGGVSRRIEDAEERKRLRQILKEIKPEGGGSFIIRTAGLEQEMDDIHQDADLLKKTWRHIQTRTSHSRAPISIYNEHDILTRVVRDHFTGDMDEILVDSKSAMRLLIRTCQDMIPSLCSRIHYYDSSINIFDTFEVEKQFQKALRRKVWMRSGGAIVIDETEALTAIDVNSGKYVGQDDQDQVILKTNLEACRMIARQLRLRDLGGLIVIDFIDMNTREHELQVMREFKRCLRSDRAKYSISDFSEFGLVQMTRKRVKKSLAHALYRPCPYCEGTGHILSEAQIWKQVKYDLIAEMERKPRPASIDIMVHSQIKTYMQTHVLDALAQLANKYQSAINVVSMYDFHHERYKIVRHEKSTIEKKEPALSPGTRRGRRTEEKKLESIQTGQDNAS